MERRIKEWIGICCVALLLAGCAQGSKTLGRDNVLNKEQVVEIAAQLPSNNRVEETLTEEILDVEAGDIEAIEIKKTTVEGLENLEVVYRIVSDLTIGDLLENVVLPKQTEIVSNQYKVDALQQLDQKYKENIPVDEKEVISLLPDIILAPKGLNLQCFKEAPDIMIDNIGVVEQRGLHIRIKGIDGTKQKVTLQRPDGSKVWIDGWFSDSNGDSYWNCFIMDIVSLEEIKEYHLIIE